MDGARYSKPDDGLQPQNRNLPATAVPRSQFAQNVRFASDRKVSRIDGPRNFSSPFRAPLHRQGHQESVIRTQGPIVNGNDDGTQFPVPRYRQEAERNSYTMFEPHPAVSPLRIVKKLPQIPPQAEASNGGSQSSYDQAGIVRQASVGHEAKTSLTNVIRSDSTKTNKKHTEIRTPPRRKTADSGIFHNDTNTMISALAPPNEVHLPPESPTSTYSQDVRRSQRLSSKPSKRTVDTSKGASHFTNIQRPATNEYEQLSSHTRFAFDSEKSSSSPNHLLGLGIDHDEVSKRITGELRPPETNAKATEDLGSRGSVTSLPDLIRRATRLAANLDRGKTASRLGILDMFSNIDHGKRQSTLADALDAFPDPSSVTAPKASRPKTMLPGDPKDGVIVSEQHVSQGKKPQRKCCGLSMTAFVMVLVLLIIVVAAAIIIPIYLVVVPKQHSSSTTNLRDCSASYSCENNGISIVDNNACSCMCVDGFTGSDCSQAVDANCITADLVSSSQTYHNATMGSSIQSLVLQTGNQLSASINTTVLLSVFSKNNLTCASENSLVQFDLSQRPKARRFIIVPGLDPLLRGVPNLPVPSRTAQHVPVATASSPVSGASGGFVRRSAYGQTLTTTATVSQSIATALSTTSSSDAQQTTSANITSGQIRFAQQVVLYMLADTRAPSAAVLAQQRIEQYLRAGGLASGNSTVDVGRVSGREVTANFAELALQ